MLTDIEIARAAELDDIRAIGQKLGIDEGDLELYGTTKAKVSTALMGRVADQEDGRLVLVTAISPTSAGEGKSTVTVGLADSLAAAGKRAVACLREPSMGPVFGRKGGAAGGGYAQVVPMDDINLHFTGDMHAITAANNLMCACIDNTLYWGNEWDLDPDTVAVRRCIDVNDRALRQLTVGRGVRKDRDIREDGFDITVASEIMAILCLASDADDLKARLGRVLVGYTRSGQPLTVHDLGIEGALAMILKDAVKPNLVQTLEHTPAFVHGGPFANIAHGASSLIATKTALKLADFVVTEAGFGADLGAEKFLDIVSAFGGLRPSCTVVVATVRALKMHGGVAEADLGTEDVEAVRRGAANLARHLESLQAFGMRCVVAVNRFATDTDAELAVISDFCREAGVTAAPCEVFAKGSEGGAALADAVIAAATEGDPVVPNRCYADEDSLLDKLNAVARRCYGADGVVLTDEAQAQLARLEELGYDRLPVCVAKTPASFTDDPKVMGAPEGFTITVRELRPSLGAGFIVCLTGKILTMPGLPKHPRAPDMDLVNGEVIGLS